MARSYPVFGNVKTITLPIAPGDDLTLDEYNEKYGIDLKPYIKLDTENHEILLEFDGLVLVNILKSSNRHTFVSSVFAPNKFGINFWVEGSESANLSLTLADRDGNWEDGINFFIESVNPFELDSIKVKFQEI